MWGVQQREKACLFETLILNFSKYLCKICVCIFLVLFHLYFVFCQEAKELYFIKCLEYFNPEPSKDLLLEIGKRSLILLHLNDFVPVMIQ